MLKRHLQRLSCYCKFVILVFSTVTSLLSSSDPWNPEVGSCGGGTSLPRKNPRIDQNSSDPYTFGLKCKVYSCCADCSHFGETTMKGMLLLVIFSLLLFSSSLATAATTRYETPKLLGAFSESRPRNLPSYRYEIGYHRQLLDHFSFAALPHFYQRYLMGPTDNWSRNGPIFFYCGNEGDIEWFAANTGFVWEVAPLFSALVVFAEHRYYGDSMPYGSKEKAYKDAKSLAYLTTEQALADFATFLTDLKRNLSSEDSPVVLFGGSYGGSNYVPFYNLKKMQLATFHLRFSQCYHGFS